MEQKKKIKEALTLPNPLWHRLQRMGNFKALYTCPKEFKYWREDKKTGDLIVPRGLLQRLRSFLQGATYVEKRQNNVPVSLKSSIVLREYQEGIPEQIIQYENGIVKCSVGFGKSTLALKVAELLGQRCLIVVPTSDIFNQFCDGVKMFFGEKHLGVIRAGETRIGDITIAMSQSLQRRIKERTIPNLSELFGIVWFDECHKSVSRENKKIVEFFNPFFLYGASGTPLDRTDEQGEAVKFLFGEIIVNATLPQKKPQVQIIKWNQPIAMSWNYHEIIDAMVEDDARNAMIAEVIKQQVERGRKTLCLVKRITHFEKIQSYLERLDLRVRAVRSDLPHKDRKELVDTLRSTPDSYDVIVGTTSLLSTGIDIPCLDTLVIGGDLKSRVLVTQSSGRILRLFSGKQDPLIIDIWDTANPILKNQGKERQKQYKLNEWEII